MKKIMLALFLLSATAAMVTLSSETVYAKSGGGGSNGIPASQVPKPVKKNFKGMYATATSVEWEYKPVYYGTPVYTASFYLGAQKWEANYNSDGTFVSAYPKV
ncbi:MAG TPA: hypothetical protein PLP23_07855 [Panacibacter sp.]|nr:hypothetical protein [Panacibacter sp.]